MFHFLLVDRASPRRHQIDNENKFSMLVPNRADSFTHKSNLGRFDLGDSHHGNESGKKTTQNELTWWTYKFLWAALLDWCLSMMPASCTSDERSAVIGDLVRPVAVVRSVPMHLIRLILYSQLIFPIYNPFLFRLSPFYTLLKCCLVPARTDPKNNKMNSTERYVSVCRRFLFAIAFTRTPDRSQRDHCHSFTVSNTKHRSALLACTIDLW